MKKQSQVKENERTHPSFMALEILRTIHFHGLHDISDIYDRIVSFNPRVASLSKSQYYRIIEKLEDRNTISAEKVGKSKFITITPSGIEELDDFLSYIYGFLRDQLFTEEVLTEIRDLTTPILGCLRQFKMMSIGPYPINLVKLLNMCSDCDNPKNADYENVPKPYFIALPGVDKTFKDNFFDLQIIDADDPYDLLPKDESVDVIFSSAVLFRYGEEQLKELHRIVKKRGIIYLLEPTSNIPNMVIKIMNQMLIQQQLSNPDAWIIGDREGLSSINEIKKVLQPYFSQVHVRPEFGFTLFICIKDIQ